MIKLSKSLFLRIIISFQKLMIPIILPFELYIWEFSAIASFDLLHYSTRTCNVVDGILQIWIQTYHTNFWYFFMQTF